MGPVEYQPRRPLFGPPWEQASTVEAPPVGVVATGLRALGPALHLLCLRVMEGVLAELAEQFGASARRVADTIEELREEQGVPPEARAPQQRREAWLDLDE
jgi:hypothetical protein